VEIRRAIELKKPIISYRNILTAHERGMILV
jgi:hypothetical protein